MALILLLFRLFLVCSSWLHYCNYLCFAYLVAHISSVGFNLFGTMAMRIHHGLVHVFVRVCILGQQGCSHWYVKLFSSPVLYYSSAS